jgi:hypothetical protein
MPSETVEQIISLDKEMAGVESEAARKLGIGVVAVLARCHDPKASAYLNEIYEKFPERRGYIATALTQNPAGENWSLMIRSLPIVEGAFAQQILIALTKVDQVPDKPEPYRQVILRGLKLGDGGGANAVKVLEKWTGKPLSQPDDKWDVALAAWQKWFAETYPDEPGAKLPVESAENKWTYDELLTYLTGPRVRTAIPRPGPKSSPRRRASNAIATAIVAKGSDRINHGQPSLPEEGNPRIDFVPVASDFRSIPEQNHHHHRRPQHQRPGRAAGGRLRSSSCNRIPRK